MLYSVGDKVITLIQLDDTPVGSLATITSFETGSPVKIWVKLAVHKYPHRWFYPTEIEKITEPLRMDEAID